MTGREGVRTQIVAGQRGLHTLHFEGKTAEDEHAISLGTPLLELGDEPLENAKKLGRAARRQGCYRRRLCFLKGRRARMLMQSDSRLRPELFGDVICVQHIGRRQCSTGFADGNLVQR